MVPTVEFPPALPSTDQFTLELLPFCTVAVNCCDCEIVKAATRGLIDIETLEGLMVTLAAADSAGLACETAMTVTVLGLGTLVGAV